MEKMIRSKCRWEAEWVASFARDLGPKAKQRMEDFVSGMVFAEKLKAEKEQREQREQREVKAV